MPIIRFFARLFVLKVIVTRLRNDDQGERTTEMKTRNRPAQTPAQTSTSAAPARPAAESPVKAPQKGGPGAQSPLELDAPDWKQTAKRAVKEIKSDRIPLASAGMAFYFFLAIFPALLAMIGIFKLFELDATGVVESISRNVPGGAGAVLTDALTGSGPSEKSSLIAAIIGIAVALFSATSGFVALQMGLNVAYDVETDRKFVGARGVALLLLLATAVFGGVPSPFFTFGEDLIFKIIGWILTVAAVSTLFSIYYFLGPNREQRPPWRWVSAGGVVGTFLWLIASLGFGYYASNIGNYGRTYGTLSGVIILIFWLYLSAFAVLAGGELNAELERQAAARPTKK